MGEQVKTILLYVTDKEEGVKAIKYLVDDIQKNEDANHKLFFKFLFNGAYYISMGTTDKEGARHFIGNHEVIFMPQARLNSLIDSFADNKNIIAQKNCMIIAGDSEKTVKLRSDIIDWLLEKSEDISL